MMAFADTPPVWPLDELAQGFTGDSLVANQHDANALRGIGITGLCHDSRRIRPGDLFFARTGAQADGGRFVVQAARAGAVAVVCTRGHCVDVGIPCLEVDDVDAAMGLIADRFFGHPSARLELIGVTGTNGKTSITYLVATALAKLHPGPTGACGIVGTLGHGLPGYLTKTNLTTPDAIDLNAALADLVERGASRAAVEVSSHALVQKRAAGLRFRIAVFTNLTHDHLDYHGDTAGYARSKRLLFERNGLRVAVLNADDAYAQEMAGGLLKNVEVIACRLAAQGGVQSTDGERLGFGRGERSLLGTVETLDGNGLSLRVHGAFGDGRIDSAMLGRFNASNLLLSLGVLLAAGETLSNACVALSQCHAPPGRLQRVDRVQSGPRVVVDYSHTPDSLEKALEVLAEITSGRLICVFGCGGDRDRAKRPQMGAIAARYADEVIVTTDNPRSEDPAVIIADIEAGMPTTTPYRIEADRRSAIALALDIAGVGDMVLIAGKGHEDYQEVAGIRRPFNDVEVASTLLRARRQ